MIALDAGKRLGFARDLIDEMEADVAARALVGDHGGQRGQSAARHLIGGDHSILLQPAQAHRPAVPAHGRDAGRVEK